MLELNIVVFIVKLYLNKPLNIISSPIKYFIVQAISSAVFIWGVIASGRSRVVPGVLYRIRIRVKLGIIPFHAWYINVLQGLEWRDFFLLSSFQKVLPLFVTHHLVSLMNLTPLLIMSSISGVIMFTQSLVKRILGYSRVFNIRIVLSTLRRSINIMWFLLFYMITMWGIVKIIRVFQVCLILDLLGIPRIDGRALLIILRSLGGVPPFLGFWAKYLIVTYIFYSHYWFLGIWWVIMSLIVMLVYLFLAYSLLLINPGFKRQPAMLNKRIIVPIVIRRPLVFLIF